MAAQRRHSALVDPGKPAGRVEGYGGESGDPCTLRGVRRWLRERRLSMIRICFFQGNRLRSEGPTVRGLLSGLCWSGVMTSLILAW